MFGRRGKEKPLNPQMNTREGNSLLARIPCFLFVLCITGVEHARAQELQPRAYWPAPVGTNVLALTYQHSQGDVIVDQSLPITGVDSSIDYVQLSYQRFLSVGGRTGTITVAQLWADGKTTGTFRDEPVTRRTTGPLDTVVRGTINLLGAPALAPGDFQNLRTNPRPILGASLTIAAPTGDYDPDRVINLGTNRWAVKPGIGGIYPLSPKWMLEAEADVWFFQDNDEFVGQTREQDPIGQVQVHLIRRFKPGFWAALDANWYVGGRTRIDGIGNADLQRNSRLGATLVYPIGGGNALRFSTSTGTVTETGGDFDLLSITWFRVF
jgi:hypothetical protein